jgi:hypothetical protein
MFNLVQQINSALPILLLSAELRQLSAQYRNGSVLIDGSGMIQYEACGRNAAFTVKYFQHARHSYTFSEENMRDLNCTRET